MAPLVFTERKGGLDSTQKHTNTHTRRTQPLLLFLSLFVNWLRAVVVVGVVVVVVVAIRV